MFRPSRSSSGPPGKQIQGLFSWRDWGWTNRSKHVALTYIPLYIKLKLFYWLTYSINLYIITLRDGKLQMNNIWWGLQIVRILIRYLPPLSCHFSRSQWTRGLRRRSAAARLLRSWVRIPPGAWMSVCVECCVLSDRGLCDELITRPEESYRLWCIVVCDQETSRMRRPWLALDRSATGGKKVLSLSPY